MSIDQIAAIVRETRLRAGPREPFPVVFAKRRRTSRERVVHHAVERRGA